MNRATYLGELEHMILLAVIRLGSAAYGKSVRAELRRRTGREVSRSAAYITLERLVEKGYLTSRMGETTEERGGRARRYYAVTEAGRDALRTAGRALMELWSGQEGLLDQPG